MKGLLIAALFSLTIAACNNGAEDAKSQATDTVALPADNTTGSSDARGSDNNGGVLDTPALTGKSDSAVNRSDTPRMTN